MPSHLLVVLFHIVGGPLLLHAQSPSPTSPSTTSSPKEVTVLTLEEVEKLARANSEEIQLKMSALDKRQGQYDEALGTALPQLAADATWQKYFKEPVFFGNQVPISQQFQSSITVNQTLWAFGRVAGALKAAKAGLKIGNLEKKLSEIEIIYMAQMSYYTVLFADKQLEIAKENLKNAQENFNILNRKFSGGRPPQGDYVRLKSDVAARTTMLKAAETNAEQARMTLAELIHKDEDTQFKLVTPFREKFPTLNREDLLQRVEQEQPRLQVLEESVKFNSEVARVQKATSLPVLSAFGSYTYSGAADRPLNSDDLFSSSYAGLALTWSIWDGGSNRARYRQALSDKTTAEIGLRQGRRQLVLSLKKSLKNYENLISVNGTAKEAVDLAQQSFKISQRRFATGQASVTEVNSTEAALTQTKTALSANIFEIHSALAEISNLLAVEQEGLK